MNNLNELFAALAKAQSEMQIAGLDASNPFFKSKYADLATITKATRPHLTKNGLCIIHKCEVSADGFSYLVTILGHSSGQYLESTMKIAPLKANDPQAIGSYITYLKRYCMAALIGCVTGDEDDDGEAAMIEVRKVQQAGKIGKIPMETEKPMQADKVVEVVELISKDQLQELEDELIDHPDLAAGIIKKMPGGSLASITKDKYKVAKLRIREIVSAHVKAKMNASPE